MPVANPGTIRQECSAADPATKTVSDQVAFQRANDVDDIDAVLRIPAFERYRVPREFHDVAYSGWLMARPSLHSSTILCICSANSWML